MSTLPVVAIVGRPNVGKSTLINRILGRREAVVQERPGVTRDRIVYDADWLGRPFVLIDTGGLESDPQGELAGKVADTARIAAAQADVAVLVVDATQGITAEDRSVAESLRAIGNRIVLVANKVDSQGQETAALEFFELGLGRPHTVSAMHGRATGDLLDEITAGFATDDPPETSEPAIAIVGRPNVGKSSLFNRLAGSELAIVHDEPGTTRDSVDTIISSVEGTFRIVDTAGLRRAMKVDDATEYYSTVRAMRSLRRSDLALLVVDATEGISRQDLRIAEQIAELGRSAILICNKTDLLDPTDRDVELQEIRRRLPYLDYAPLIATSATKGRGLKQILPAAKRILEGRDVRIPTPALNNLIDDVQARTPIPSKRPSRVKYAVQVETSPPVILLYGAFRPPPQWIRHLERSIRAKYGFEGTPIHLVGKGSSMRRREGA